MRIAILAKGETLSEYAEGEYDEVWGLNQIGKSHELDRLFVMDDFKLRLPYYDGNEFPEWLKSYSGRLITSRQYDEWPSSEEFPLVEVAHFFGLPLGIAMYSTVDYMFAMAIYEGVSEIHTFGVDCRHGEKLDLIRTSIAVWIGAALSRGIRVTSKQGSFSRWWTYAGRCMEQGLYGYVERPRIEELAGSKVT